MKNIGDGQALLESGERTQAMMNSDTESVSADVQTALNPRPVRFWHEWATASAAFPLLVAHVLTGARAWGAHAVWAGGASSTSTKASG